MAGRYDFEITQNTTFSRWVAWADADGPVDMTAWSAALEIRSWPLGILEAAISTSAGGIVIDGPPGVISLFIPASVTVLMTPGVAKYSLLVTNLTPATSCLLSGDVFVRQGATH